MIGVVLWPLSSSEAEAFLVHVFLTLSIVLTLLRLLIFEWKNVRRMMRSGAHPRLR